MSPEQFHIECCADDDRVDAFRLLHAGLSEDQQNALPMVLNALHAEGETSYPGLLVARDVKDMVGAVWVQLAPGSTAIVWPPAIGGPASEELIRASASFLDQQRVALAQILLSPDAPQDPQLLAAGDFRRLVELDYLAIEKASFPTASTSDDLQFAAAASDHPQRLGRLLLETYEQTLDCPQLNGLRNAADVLAGYAAQGEFSVDCWFFVRQAGKDVGVLILTPHPGSATWELVYMGVVPAARGNGLGAQIVNFALAQASAGGAERLVLAVDQTNEPALVTYRAAGFVGWNKRTVYARLNRG
jgi:ribosomal protein S18 acetylase RimI-like enzyme